MRLTLAGLFCGFALSLPSFACSCVSSGGCPGLGNNSVPVFVGTVLSVTDLHTGGDFLSSRKARIRVDDSFGGIAPGVKEVDVLTGLGGGDCGIPFQAGDIYLIQAFSSDDGLLHVGLCSATRKINGSSTVLPILRARRDNNPVPSLAGQISQVNRNFDGLNGTHAPQALANLRIRVTSNGKTYETTSDSEGVFVFFDLPRGLYDLSPDLPPATTLSWFIGSDQPLAPFQLMAGACQERDVQVFQAGSIQGRLLDPKGAPISDALVYIVPAETQEIPNAGKLYREGQDKQGVFKFVHLPPGNYLMLVNPDDKLDPRFPYRRTFFPGVSDRQLATMVTIHEGEQVEDADIHLTPAFAPRHLTARVTWTDGSPTQGYLFFDVKGVKNPQAVVHTQQPDMKGNVVDILVHPDEPYTIRASLTCRYGDGRSAGPARLQSNPFLLNPKDGVTEITLALPAPACAEAPTRTPIGSTK